MGLKLIEHLTVSRERLTLTRLITENNILKKQLDVLLCFFEK